MKRYFLLFLFIAALLFAAIRLWGDIRPNGGTSRAAAAFARLDRVLPGGFHALPCRGTLGDLRIRLAVEYRRHTWKSYTATKASGLESLVDIVIDRIEHVERYDDQPELDECEHTQCVLAARDIFAELARMAPNGYRSLPNQPEATEIRKWLEILETKMRSDVFGEKELKELDAAALWASIWLAPDEARTSSDTGMRFGGEGFSEPLPVPLFV